MKDNKSRKWVITISLILLIILIASAVIGVVFYLKNKKKNNTSANNDSYIIQNNNSSLKQQPNSTRSFLNQKTIRVGHWNVLNQGGINQLKNEALAKVILKSNVDIIFNRN